MRRFFNLRALLLVGVLLSLALPASANAGTLLMWAEMGHLYIGNLLIGYLEAFFLSRVFGVRFRVAEAPLIVANYASMGAGVLFLIADAGWLHVSTTLLGDAPLYRLPFMLAIMVVVHFTLTVLVEWPFYRHAFRRNQQVNLEGVETEGAAPISAALIFRATVLTQVVSYAGLAVIYLLVSGTGFVRNARITHDVSFAAHPHAQVYYSYQGQPFRITLDGSPAVRVAKEEMGQALLTLFSLPSEEDNDFKRMHNSTTYGPVFDLAPTQARVWKGRTDFWGTSGLSLSNPRTGMSFSLGLELPFITWRSRHATFLPGDQVVYEFGPQIVLFDIPSRRMAFLAKGSRPFVVLEP